jgi:hypothetical protein
VARTAYGARACFLVGWLLLMRGECEGQEAAQRGDEDHDGPGH